jgi:Flp pilus assembly protein TadG
MRRFLADRRGNYALMTAVAMVPLMGGLALAVDFSEMNRQKQAVANALDAAGIATAREVVTGASDNELIAYANSFFKANLEPDIAADTTLTVTLPPNTNGGGTLKLAARLD